MKMNLLTFAFLFATNSALMAQFSYEIPIKVTHIGQPDKPLERIEIEVVAADSSSAIKEQMPGRTDDEGKAVIRFKASTQNVTVFYLVSDGPDGEKWFITPKSPKPTPRRREEADDRNSSSRSLETFFAFPAKESALVASKQLEMGNTEMVAAAVAEAILIPPANNTSPGPIMLSDPLRSYEIVAKILHTSPEVAKNVIQKWQSLVDSAPGAAKPDEKSLSALLKGDIGKATEFAKVAAGLNEFEKSQLVAISDTGRLAETLYQLNISAQDSASEPRSIAAEAQLKRLEQSIKPLRPTSEGRFPASAFDASKLDKFSKTVREKASNIRE